LFPNRIVVFSPDCRPPSLQPRPYGRGFRYPPKKRGKKAENPTIKYIAVIGKFHDKPIPFAVEGVY
jgi:hypothetical protein